MDTQQKLQLLADASRFDLACACGTKDQSEHRQRQGDGMWLYPVQLPSGGTGIMLKTLLSNACVNDCRYCPFRAQRQTPRCSLEAEEVARVFMAYQQRLHLHGLFLSSGVIRDADHTMARIAAVGEILRRRYHYRGYLHLKVIPGASPAAIEAVLHVASAVSLNVEVPTRSAFQTLSAKKDFDRDIVTPMRQISALTAAGAPFAQVRQSTQFIVGAAAERDCDIVRATYGLYHRLHLDRVYYSAYQRGLGDPALPGETAAIVAGSRDDLLTREHRLYQVDFLLRKYGWDEQDIAFEADGNLGLAVDPKQRWADRHPEYFPVRLATADREQLLRVPGLGPVSVKRLLATRRQGGSVTLAAVGLRGKRQALAARYVVPQ